MNDPLDFLDGQAPADTTAVVSEPNTPEPAVETTLQEGPIRDDKGRFAPKVEAKAEEPKAEAQPQAPAPTPEAVQPAPEAAKPPEGFVPISVVQEMRNEIKALKQQQTLHPQPPPMPAPDPYEDFEAYREWQQGQIVAERAEWSYQIAAIKHGEERAQEVRQWAAERFAQDPIFAQRAMSSRDPYGVAFDEWKREQVFTKLSDPALLDKFLAFASGQQAPQAQAQASAAPPPQPAAPPPSITSAPSAGGVQHVPLGQSEVYGSVFG